MKVEIDKILDILIIKRGPGTGISESITWDGNETYKELPDIGAEIQISPSGNSGEVRFYFGYDTDYKQFKRELVLSKSQVKEVIKHLTDLL